MFKIDECLSLTEAVVQDAVDVFSDYYGVEMSLEQCVEIIKTNKTLAADLYASNSAHDTCTREYLIDALVLMIMGKGHGWPCNGDGPEKSRKFFSDFAVAAAKAGYKISGDCE